MSRVGTDDAGEITTGRCAQRAEPWGQSYCGLRIVDAVMSVFWVYQKRLMRVRPPLLPWGRKERRRSGAASMACASTDTASAIDMGSCGAAGRVRSSW